MPSVSVAQRRLFGACEHGADWPSCPHMAKDKIHDFAVTKEHGLPQHVKAPVHMEAHKARKPRASSKMLRYHELMMKGPGE